MADPVLPYAGSASAPGVVFDINNSNAGGTGIRGEAQGFDPWLLAIGVEGVSTSGGIGVSGYSPGNDRSLDSGIGVLGKAEYGGSGVVGIAEGTTLLMPGEDPDDGGPGIGVTGNSDNGGIGVEGVAVGLTFDGRGGRGVFGATNHGGIGVLGKSGGVDGDGVPGQGVFGSSQTGVGVYGQTTSGFAMAAEGDAVQSRSMGGWIKAMVYLAASDPTSSVRTIQRCFNSQRALTSNNPGDCGFQEHRLDSGVYVIDFGFTVDDRYVSVTAESSPSGTNPLNPSTRIPSYDPFTTNFVIANCSFFSASEVMVVTYVPVMDYVNQRVAGFLPTDCNFFLSVF